MENKEFGRRMARCITQGRGIRGLGACGPTIGQFEGVEPLVSQISLIQLSFPFSSAPDTFRRTQTPYLRTTARLLGVMIHHPAPMTGP